MSGNNYYKQVPEQFLKDPQPLPSLTERENEYLSLLCYGWCMENIAEKMSISIRSVEHHRDHVYRKLNVTNKADLLFYITRTGMAFIRATSKAECKHSQ
jgi:DNA-binding NarL/FixJ family response regulator